MKRLVMVVWIMCLVAQVAFGQGQCVILDVPYIHQVLDMNQNVFWGHNACGPTSAVTILNRYGLLPPNTSGYPGYYVYNGYAGCTDISGETYTTYFARDWHPTKGTHANLFPGAHGFIVEDVYHDGTYWGANQESLRTYLQNHGLDVSNWIYSNLMSTIQTEVNAGRPLIGHVTISIGNNNYGHYLVITGVSSLNQIVVNDPYGDYTKGHWGGSSNGKGVVYDINAIHLDRVITIKPNVTLVGYALNGSRNQAIVDCFNRHGGKTGVGWVINDGGSGYVHNWLPYSYICQNFRNAKGQESIIMYGAPFANKAFLISGAVWEYYRYGYNGHNGPDIRLPNGKRLGAPTSDAIGGCQLFENGYYIEKIHMAIPLKSLTAKAASVNQATVELHQLDGTLVESYGATGDLSALILSGKTVSSQQIVLVWLGGLAGDFFQVLDNGVQVGVTALPEFTQTGMTPGSLHRYQVVTMSNDSGQVASSNEVTLVLPGQQGSFTLQASARPDCGGNMIDLTGQNSLYLTQFYLFYRDGVMVGNLAVNPGQTEFAYSDWPVEPNTTYTYQVMATNLSGTQLGWSNSVSVTTPIVPPGPPPDPSFPTTVAISLNQTTWAYATGSEQTGNYVTAQVFDQYGNVMSSERVSFISSDPQVFTVDGDSGWCIAQGLGSAQVWAQCYDWSGIRSEMINVTVVAELPPEPCVSDVYSSAPVKLDALIEILGNQPFLEHDTLTGAVTLRNPTNAPFTLWGPRLFTFDLNGCKVDDSSYSSSAKTLQPNESYRFIVTGQFQSAGQYYLMAMISFTGSYAGQWYVVDQTVEGVANKLYYRSVSQSDLRPDLQSLGFWVKDGISIAGQPIQLITRVINRGDADVTVPFTVTAQIRGGGKQDYELNGLARGYFADAYFDLPPLMAGTYVADLAIDSGNIVLEYDKSNNGGFLSFTVDPAPLPPTITLDPQSQTVLVGGQTSFTVTAVRPNPPDEPADDPLSYQWQKDGTDISGATSNIYTISNVSSDQGGSYACVVKTARGVSATSNTAVLTVETPIPVFPDMTATLNVSPRELRLGGTVTLSGTVPNNGTADAAACQLALTFGEQTAVIDLPPIAKGTSVNYSHDFTLTQIGQVIATVTADSINVIIESDETNNGANATVTVLPPLQPDLVCSIEPAKPTFYTNEEPQVKVIVSNSGQSEAAACRFALRLAQGNPITTADIPALTIGQSFNFTITIGALSVGDWPIVGIIDSDNEIAESDETDNSATAFLRILPPLLPDWFISSAVPGKTQYLTTENPVLSVVVGNDGTATAPACQLAVKNASGTVLATVNVPALAVGQSQTLTITLPNLAAGSWTLTVMIDSQNAITENDESNNIATTSFTVTNPIVPKLPDLTPTTPSFQSFRWFFGLVNFTVPAKNIGQATAGKFRISVYIPEMNKTLTKDVSSLNTGASNSFGFTLWSVPKNVTLQITVDSLNRVTESNEANNYLEVKKSL